MATTASGTEFSGEVPAALQAEGEKLPPGLGPWTLAWRRLRRNHVALFFGGLFLLIVVLCLLAPVYAKHIAHQRARRSRTSPGPSRSTARTPTSSARPASRSGPTWHSKYFLGSDANGRDVAVRLLYGGRNSLEIGFVATLITMVLALILGIVSGLLPRDHRRVHLPIAGRDLGVPRDSARGHAGDRAGRRRSGAAAEQHAAAPGDRRRDRLHPVRRQAGPRTGADDARARVHRRRAPAGPQ